MKLAGDRPINVNCIVIGLGAVGKCFLALIFRHLRIDPSRLIVIDGEASVEVVRMITSNGGTFVGRYVTKANFGEVLGPYLHPGAIVIDLALNTDSHDLAAWCHHLGVHYVNSSIEVWPAHHEAAEQTVPSLDSRYRRVRRMALLKRRGATSILDHGANPGLVSHFVKRALMDMWSALVDLGRIRGDIPLGEKSWGRMASLLDIRLVHVSERDSQDVDVGSAGRTQEVFVNTWSPEAFLEEARAPAEVALGDHESAEFGRDVRPGGESLGRVVTMGRPGMNLWIRSWVPSGEIVGISVRHGDALSIADTLTVAENGVLRYRPSACYVYAPCRLALESLKVHGSRGLVGPGRQELITEDISDGANELGVLLMGRSDLSWWTGSVLSIEGSRDLVDGQNSTTVQVAAGVIAAVRWITANPDRGILLPDDLPHEEMLALGTKFLGSFRSGSVPWRPALAGGMSCTGASSATGRACGTWQVSSFSQQADE